MNPTFTRQGGNPIVSGIRAHSLDDFLPVVIDLSEGRELILSDGSLGSWRADHLATEIFEQMGGRPLPLDPFHDLKPSGTIADQIGTWIDLETAGDRLVYRALALAKECHEILRDTLFTICIIVPRFGLKFDTSDVCFIRFLIDAINGTNNKLLLVDFGQDGEEFKVDGWVINWSEVPRRSAGRTKEALVTLIPGIVTFEIHKAFEDSGDQIDLWRFRKGFWIIPPEARRPPEGVSSLQFDELIRIFSGGWIRAYAMCFCNGALVDSKWLVAEGAKQVNSYNELGGLRLLDRAIVGTSGEIEQWMIVAYAQGLRIAVQRFKQASEAPDPPTSLPSDLRGMLHQQKGWALLMAGEPGLAAQYLQGAIKLLLPSWRGAREALYLLNIFALSYLRSGDLESAMGLEHVIEKSRISMHPHDYQLSYVNCLNLARLYRYRGFAELSKKYYLQAFGPSEGARSSSDALYLNACLAQVANIENDVHQELLGWMRAAIHWLSSSTPETLARRVAKMLLHRNPKRGEYIVCAVSRSIRQKLATIANVVGLCVDHETAERPLAGGEVALFVNNLQRGDSNTNLHAIGGPGWGILASTLAAQRVIESVDYDDLGQIVVRILDQLCPSAQVSQYRTFLVDDRFGAEMPTTLEELIGVCVRRRIPTITFEAKTMNLNSNHYDAAERTMSVQRSMCLKDVKDEANEVFAIFKRSIAPKKLSALEATILSILNRERSASELYRLVGGGYAWQQVLNCIRGLERDRIVVTSTFLTTSVEEVSKGI